MQLKNTVCTNWYKSKKVFNKAIPKSGRTLEPVSDNCKTQEMRIKAADKYVHILKFFSDRYKTHKIYIKAVGIRPSTSFIIHPSSDQHKTQ